MRLMTFTIVLWMKQFFFKIMFFFMNGMQICFEKKNLDFFKNFTKLTDAIYDICESFMNETIEMLINLHGRNLIDATNDI